MYDAQQTTRRSFLKTTLTTGLVASSLAPLVRAQSPNAKVQHASIGTGGMAWGDLNQFAAHPNVEIVAFCDVDKRRMASAIKKFPKARPYQDWRELLDKEADRIDSINVTVPDHTHAPVTMTALLKGKHVYCQKPLTHDIYEARQIAAAAKKAGVITQMGNQLSSGRGDRMAVQMIQEGWIGKIKEVYMWSNKDPERYRPKGPRPEKTDPIPTELNWEWWCGTAPVRPYVHDTYHPTWWRGWQDFGCGWLGDMGCHIMDAPYRALGIGMPLRVHAEVEPEWRNDPARRTETFPTWQILTYTFAGTKFTAGKTIKLTWSDGSKYPPAKLEKLLQGQKYPTQGALFIGEEGVLLLPHMGGPRLFPQEKFQKRPRPKLQGQHHYHQFIDAINGKNNGRTQSPFSYAGPVTEMVLLGTVALRFPDQELKWNADALRVTNIPQANQFVRRKYQQGWEVKGL